ncbi:hypothetical protein CFBP5507_05995 [Agrobacterium salinitolerans]|uniref:Uncharacterized protein n=1 Tax=Agrobacterium salinitolerans TaxID=1183413 RepID=A0A4Z1QWE8_9HYPH|nr:hypothetical protein [Agrobacterium salinitolerans]UYZ08551.1 hypothetical protein CFBP5507_05995 [Agrobacterium salinitolerans]
MAGITDYLTSKIKGLLTPERWDGFIRALDVRFGVLEEQLGIERRVTESILQRGLQVIEDGIGPAIIQAEQAANNISAIANLGMVFTAPSATTVLIGMGQKSFTIPANRKDQFAPAAIMMAYAGSDYSNAIIGSTASYNRSTGVLVLDVIETIGSGIFNDWTLTPVATTADLEALRDQVQADRLQAGLNAGAAVNAKNDAQSIATDFRAKYLGSRTTDPTTDGNGNPVSIGALYTNSGSGKLRYYGLSGWQDTTAGSNIVRYTFVTDDRGTAPYPLPEAPASKDNCFVIAGNNPLKGSAFNVDGTNFSFVTDPGVGVTVEVKIIAQLAIGTPSDETVDAAKIKTDAVAGLRAKLGINDPTTATVGAAIAAANGLATPDDADTFAGVKSGTSTMFRTTWGNIKTALTTLFDGRYLKLAGGVIDGTLGVRSGAPTINLIDTDNNQTRSLHHNSGVIGFLNTSGDYTLQVNDSGQVWSANYGWFHDRFAQAGANCQHNSGVVEFSGFDTGITDSIGQASNPYVVIGLRRGNVGAGNATYLRCVALRNR